MLALSTELLFNSWKSWISKPNTIINLRKLKFIARSANVVGARKSNRGCVRGVRGVRVRGGL